ncbi:MAG TPA: peptidoglycan recognition family protein [Terriglobales bacterium]|jgi:N-acetylmuramoyl-L-alanine amidase|nr:peptidoglycan recognition family protein [Terriglobales bacterium]
MTLWIGCPRTNFYLGRRGFRPEAMIIHGLDGDLAHGESVFLDPASLASPHYAISLSGTVHQYVDEKHSAFHAGIVVNPQWKQLKEGVNPNFYTIGIALEGRSADPHPEAQLTAGATLILEVAARWGIPLDSEHVVEHSRIRPSRNCPGSGLNVANLLVRIPASITPLTLRTTRNVNLRSKGPNTASPIDRILPAGSNISVVGFAVGERVEGNAYWYTDKRGNFVWAGATDMPLPSPVA